MIYNENSQFIIFIHYILANPVQIIKSTTHTNPNIECSMIHSHHQRYKSPLKSPFKSIAGVSLFLPLLLFANHFQPNILLSIHGCDRQHRPYSSNCCCRAQMQMVLVHLCYHHLHSSICLVGTGSADPQLPFNNFMDNEKEISIIKK